MMNYAVIFLGIATTLNSIGIIILFNYARQTNKDFIEVYKRMITVQRYARIVGSK